MDGAFRYWDNVGKVRWQWARESSFVLRHNFTPNPLVSQLANLLTRNSRLEALRLAFLYIISKLRANGSFEKKNPHCFLAHLDQISTKVSMIVLRSP